MLSGPGHCRKWLKPGEALQQKRGFSFFNWYGGGADTDDVSNAHAGNTLLNSPFHRNVRR